MSYLVSKGCDANIVRKDGFSALHAAVDSDSVLSIRALVIGGAKVDIRNNDDETPLHLVRIAHT